MGLNPGLDTCVHKQETKPFVLRMGNEAVGSV